jgi:hypothetical protein
MTLFMLALEGKVKGLAGGVKYYLPPTQLRYWGDHDAHPETDWMDLFFGKAPHGKGECARRFILS